MSPDSSDLSGGTLLSSSGFTRAHSHSDLQGPWHPDAVSTVQKAFSITACRMTSWCSDTLSSSPSAGPAFHKARQVPWASSRGHAQPGGDRVKGFTNDITKQTERTLQERAVQKSVGPQFGVQECGPLQGGRNRLRCARERPG